MNINGQNWRSIWLQDGGNSISVIDQTKLPHHFKILELSSCSEVVDAINSMVVRGAPLIGVVGAYGLMLALLESPTDKNMESAIEKLISTRPTAVNLRWAIERVVRRVKPLKLEERVKAARNEADLIAEEDVSMCEAIGKNGLTIFQKLLDKRPQNKRQNPLNVLTHCNAGWLATVDWGTALSPIYKAHRSGMQIHVWVDETRPRNQGATLTAFELAKEGVPHTLIVDNAGGYLMQKGLVDVVIVGADRITYTGDVCNKIGTYLKALAAHDNNIPFYVAVPSSTIDWKLLDWRDIKIEERNVEEVTEISGLISDDTDQPHLAKVNLTLPGIKAFNPAFDVTPSDLVTALITERGVLGSNQEDLSRVFDLP